MFLTATLDRVTRAAAVDPELAALCNAHDQGGAIGLLRLAIDGLYRGRIAMVSSFGAESAVLLHLAASVDRHLPVLFVDTGQLFTETLAYRDRLVRHLGLTDVRSVAPDRQKLQQIDPTGDLWRRDPEACCRLRKVAPLAAALAPFGAWISGRKRYHGGERIGLAPVERLDGRIKLDPIVDWGPQRIAAWFRHHDLPHHPLQGEGYTSIGCAPCTQPVAAKENVRAGRWPGSQKTECGIHLPALAAN